MKGKTSSFPMSSLEVKTGIHSPSVLDYVTVNDVDE